MDAPRLGRLTRVTSPASTANAFNQLSAASRSWFENRLGSPTLAQRLAWPIISAGENLLLQSPTGSGKTLAAFLPIIDALLATPETTLQCVYIAPYKALIQDTRKMLRRCARGVRAFGLAGTPAIPIDSRTGDTTAQRRAELYSDPPRMLLSTPESLALLLSRPGAGDLFRHVRWLIVDEVHALSTYRADEGMFRTGCRHGCAGRASALRFEASAPRASSVATRAPSLPRNLVEYFKIVPKRIMKRGDKAMA